MEEFSGSEPHYFALPVGAKLYEFEIEGVLGHGGFGITYRANDTLLQETVAIKEFLPNEVAVRVSDATIRAKSERDRPDFEIGLKAFLEEARVMARFRHPRIVHVRRFFEMHGTGYIVLDYEHGMTLSDRLGAEPLREGELRGLLSGVLDGLEVIHNRAILHRDLKPNNIMLREDGAPVIIDFGAARDFQARHSRSVTAIATAGYAPPEQYGVGGQQGPWSDLYALGAIAYRAVSGATPVDSLRRLRNDPLVPAVTVAAGKYDETLLRTIDWMLKVDEAERPVSVAQVREALGGGGIPATGLSAVHGPVSAPLSEIGSTDALQTAQPKAARPTSRLGKLTAIAGSLLLLAGVATGSYALYTNKQAELQAREREQAQQQLAQQFNEAGSDHSKLEQFLTACNQECPDTLRSQAQARIDAVKKQRRQADLRSLDEAMYQSARGDIDKLKAYDSSCSLCMFRETARSESALIEKQKQRAELEKREDAEYQAARGDKVRLNAYANQCEVCAYRSASKNEIESILRREAAREPSACDRLAAAPSDPQVPPGVTSVSFASIQPDEAIPACREAVQAFPNEPRFHGQMGRALHVAKAYTEAANHYKIGSDLGNGPATNNLGMLYSNGTGVEKDNERAARLFQKAVDQDIPPAMTNLARAYQQGLGVAKDDMKAFQLHQKAAEFNVPESVSSLALMYFLGQGTSKNYTEALRQFRRAAGGYGNRDAYFYLGLMHQNGLGVEKDLAESMRLYSIAADRGDPDAMSNLGAILLLGQGVPKDYSRAITLLNKSADLGNGSASHYMGVIYQNGHGVAKDASQAKKFYLKAIDKNVSQSMANLGVMNLLGQGMSRDYTTALALLQRASDLGNGNAMANLGFMYANGNGVPKNSNEAFRLYRKAADLGDVTGMINLAVVYIQGLGIARDREAGVHLLRKAADLGSSVAQNYLKRIGAK